MATESTPEQNLEDLEDSSFEFASTEFIEAEDELLRSLWETDPNLPLEPTEVAPDWQEVFEYAVACGLRQSLSRADAEDVAQSLIKKLFTKNFSIRHWHGYVNTMVKNRSIDLKRSLTWKTSESGGLPEPGAYAWRVARTVMRAPISVAKPQDLSNELASNAVLIHILSEVPENHRDLFIDYLEGVPLDYLAEIYGYASARSVTQTISRIKRNLRERFESEQSLFGEFA